MSSLKINLQKQFSEITGATPSDADYFLEHSNFNLETAVSNYLENGGKRFTGDTVVSGNNDFMAQQLAMMSAFENQNKKKTFRGE